jgi:uncharacterized membrane protein YvbJ
MFCKKCAYPLEENDTYCRNCGEYTGKGSLYLSDSLEEERSNTTPKEKIKLFPLILGAIVIIVLTVIALYLGYSVIKNI